MPIDNIKQLETWLKETLEQIRAKSPIKDFFDRYVATLTVEDAQDNLIILLTTNNFTRQVINNDFLKEIKQLFNEKSKTIEYDFKVITPQDNSIRKINKNNDNLNQKSQQIAINLNPNYTFDNLTQGYFNKSVCLAGKNVCNENFINPLFICGSVGLGKTHILHAIGNEFIKSFPQKLVKYVSSDDLSREIYTALNNSDKLVIENLKNEYEKIDLWLIDDIQMLANRSKINDILFNIFNNNIAKNKYIVWTSDENPDFFNGFQDRMKSRFHSGIYLTIHKPDIDSLKKIAQDKIKSINSNYVFSNDALNWLIRRNQNDIRRLIGSINQVMFFAATNLTSGAVITIDTLKPILDANNSERIKKYGYDVDPDIIIKKVALSYGVNDELIKSKIKTKNVIAPRNVCMYILRKKFNMTYTQIGHFFSGRDHSTVMSAIEKIEKILKTDTDLKNTIENIYKNV